MEQKKKIKIIIIVLAILLGLSLLALGGTLIYNKIANTTPAAVTVPPSAKRLSPSRMARMIMTILIFFFCSTPAHSFTQKFAECSAV